jgi:hypothetical protein
VIGLDASLYDEQYDFAPLPTFRNYSRTTTGTCRKISSSWSTSIRTWSSEKRILAGSSPMSSTIRHNSRYRSLNARGKEHDLVVILPTSSRLAIWIPQLAEGVWAAVRNSWRTAWTTVPDWLQVQVGDNLPQPTGPDLNAIVEPITFATTAGSLHERRQTLRDGVNPRRTAHKIICPE